MSIAAWGWLSTETVATLVLACEVGASANEHDRFNEMRLVAHVVLNRIESERFAETTPQEVVLAPRQFSCVGDHRWKGLLAGSKTQRYPRHWPPVLNTARLAWRSAVMERDEWGEDPTRGALYYFSPVSMRDEWYGPDGDMPRGWPGDLVETTPGYVDSNRFRFFAFPGDVTDHSQTEADPTNVARSYLTESEASALGLASVDIAGRCDDDTSVPSPGAPSTAGNRQPAGRSRFDP